MIHDPLCPWFESTQRGTVISCDDCHLIFRARVDATRIAVGMALRYLQTHTRDDTLIYLEEGGM